jgi:hypothetical protein
MRALYALKPTQTESIKRSSGRLIVLLNFIIPFAFPSPEFSELQVVNSLTQVEKISLRVSEMRDLYKVFVAYLAKM